ncbi:hypothetical protein C2845_PM16G05960 [Panicum miliaceum]|uniref:Uncharacterized protein n=1 Tax=Panicum miliaceum TaxID=4540 RepID=A0A3L6PSI6_PANMI|nr:hypothetical protein C2845_PM16G05960 [Panicum miliaceum]
MASRPRVLRRPSSASICVSKFPRRAHHAGEGEKGPSSSPSCSTHSSPMAWACSPLRRHARRRRLSLHRCDDADTKDGGNASPAVAGGARSVAMASRLCRILVAVSLHGLDEKREKGGGRQVYYEIMWEREDSLGERIEQAWGQENTKGDLGIIHHALKNTLQSLKQWSMAHFVSVRKEIERLRELLAEQQADVGQMKRPSRILSET